MDPKDIRELIELVSSSNFKCFELEREGFRIKLVKQDASEAAVLTTETAAAVPIQTVVPATAAAAPAVGTPAAPAEEGLFELPSPIVGTFYRSAGPDEAPFVEVGARVTQGQVLCIIEAMKVMNEIESEVDGEIVEIGVANGQPVEFGDVLSRIRTAG